MALQESAGEPISETDVIENNYTDDEQEATTPMMVSKISETWFVGNAPPEIANPSLHRREVTPRDEAVAAAAVTGASSTVSPPSYPPTHRSSSKASMPRVSSRPNLSSIALPRRQRQGSNYSNNSSIHKTIHTSRHLTDEARSSVTQQHNGVDRSLEEQQRQACEVARSVYHKEFVDKPSMLLDMTDNFPKFLEQEIVYGDVLGKGGFGTVSEIRGFALQPQLRELQEVQQPSATRLSDVDVDVDPTKFVQRRHSFETPRPQEVPDVQTMSGELESRRFMAQNVFRKEGHARYALKQLSPEIVADAEQLITGLADLVNEARILSAMEHPNIIKLRATQSGDHFQADFFLAMDRLYETLAERVIVWQKRDKPQTIIKKMTARLKFRKTIDITQTDSYQDRIIAVFHLSSALNYMHRQRLMHRDIKPENIGFDVRGDIKIFDFGLAKELPQLQAGQEAVTASYKFTGRCGSPRYMAPEVAWRKHYNETADVYSFSILFWELMTLSQAYATHSEMKSMYEKVWNRPHMRPNLEKLKQQQLSSPILQLINHAWHFDASQRPPMATIESTLKAECLQFPGITPADLGHVRRKSRVIYDKHRQLFRVNSNQFVGKRKEYQMATWETGV